ncbi:hypothetical protein SAMN03159363_5697 [Variovorax sp. EL159]|nr:hypothetical protein SAMN03159363_5697 [Variovorax sp. EL159]
MAPFPDAVVEFAALSVEAPPPPMETELLPDAMLPVPNAELATPMAVDSVPTAVAKLAAAFAWLPIAVTPMKPPPLAKDPNTV